MDLSIFPAFEAFFFLSEGDFAACYVSDCERCAK